MRYLKSSNNTIKLFLYPLLFIVQLFVLDNRSMAQMQSHYNKIDTIYTSNYFWLFSVTSNEDIYFIKKYNKLYHLVDDSCKLSRNLLLDYYPDYFEVTTSFVYLETIGDKGFEKRIILQLSDYQLIYCLESDTNINYSIYLFPNSTKILKLKFIPYPLNPEYRPTYIYDIIQKKELFFCEGTDYVSIDQNNINIYYFSSDYFQNTDNKCITKVKSIELSNYSIKEFDITIRSGYNVLFLLENKYLAFKLGTSNNFTLYLSNFKGEQIKKWSIDINPNNIQSILKNGRIIFYNWQNTDNENLGKYYFVKQEIDLSEFLTDEEKKLQEKVK